MRSVFDSADKDSMIAKMVDNLPVLRAKLGLTQEQLGSRVSLSRQTVVALECHKREMTWQTFLSMVMVFSSNDETYAMLEMFGIYSVRLREYLGAKS